MVLRIACLASLAFASSAACSADALPVLDQNPLIAGFAALAPPPARVPADRAWSVEATLAWGSTALVQTSPRESLLVDAETREWRLIALRGLPNGYAVRVQLPYRQMSAGSLDGFIDQWHETFDLPEGARPSLPEDSLRLFYRRDGIVQIDSASPRQGVGDASFEIGRALVNNPHSALTGWLGLKLPSGDADDFTGSGSVDVTASLASTHRFDERWSVFGHITGAWLGEGERLPDRQRDWMASASAGISVRAIGALVLTLQVDAHSAIFDALDAKLLGEAVMLTIGGAYRFASDWELTLGVSEDIAVETAPDVVFIFGLKKVI